MRRPAHERCTPFDPMTEGGQTLTCPGRYIDDLDLRVDTQRKLDTRPDVEVEIWQQVDFIQQHQIGLGEHVRILQRLVLAFGDRQYDYLMRLTEVDSRRADEIADILDEEKAALIQWQVIERVADHVCVEMTAPQPVFIWIAGVPATRILPVSFEVCWSPSITLIGKRCFKSAIVRTSSDVLPEPGLETRLSVKIPAAFSRSLFARAKAPFLERMSRSKRIMRSSRVPGIWASARSAPKLITPARSENWA